MKPTTDETTYTVLKRETKIAPKISFTETAILWIYALVECHSEEVGFFGIVDEVEGGYLVRDIFYPKHQEANGGTCEISPEGESIMANWLISKGRIDDCAKVRFWGHSHHNMGVSPSGQDENQSIEKMNQRQAYFIRAICNKKEEMSVSFYDYVNQIRFDHIKWGIIEDNDAGEHAEIIEKIEKIMNGRAQNKNKIESIRKAIDPSHKYDAIKTRVEELKKVNIPSKTIMTTQYANYGRGFDYYSRDYCGDGVGQGWPGNHRFDDNRSSSALVRPPTAQDNFKSPGLTEKDAERLIQQWKDAE